MKLVARILIVLAAAAVFGWSVIPSRAGKATETGSVKLGLFSHETAAHRTGKYKDCSSCHTIPTQMKQRSWTSPRRDKKPPFPDIVDFPYHTSCFGCHTKDIYSNGAAFCGTCHTEASMRARAIQNFPVRSHGSQFNIIFPHNVHQDLIAGLTEDTGRTSAGGPSFRTEAPQFNNCSICHKTTSDLPKVSPRVLAGLQPLGPAAADTFQAKPEFFKDSPDSHASCFSCHYQNVQPDAKNCAGCHSLTKRYFEKPGIQRYSLKFDHNSTNHVKDCATCHIRITQNSDIRTMRDADVPILTCDTSSCHGKDLSDELTKREATLKAKQPAFQCVFCHSPAIGRYPVPPSHVAPQ